LIGFSCGAALAFTTAALRAPASLSLQPAAITAIALASQVADQITPFLILAVFIDVLLTRISRLPISKSLAPSPI
jgi:hypothetical protein